MHVLTYINRVDNKGSLFRFIVEKYRFMIIICPQSSKSGDITCIRGFIYQDLSVFSQIDIAIGSMETQPKIRVNWAFDGFAYFHSRKNY